VRVKNQSDGCRSIKTWENLSKAKESAVNIIQHLLNCRQSRKFKDETHAVIIAEVSLKLGTLTVRVDKWLTFLDEVEKEYTDLVWRRYNKLIGRSKHNENNQDTDGI
jgi:hypothetical protein